VLFTSYVNEVAGSRLIADASACALTSASKIRTILIGLFIGGMLPFLFVAYTMERWARRPAPSCSKCAADCRPKPGILNHTESPKYGTASTSVTKAALRK